MISKKMFRRNSIKMFYFSLCSTDYVFNTNCQTLTQLLDISYIACCQERKINSGKRNLGLESLSMFASLCTVSRAIWHEASRSHYQKLRSIFQVFTPKTKFTDKRFSAA